jgi:hypothetical protein
MDALKARERLLAVIQICSLQILNRVDSANVLEKVAKSDISLGTSSHFAYINRSPRYCTCCDWHKELYENKEVYLTYFYCKDCFEKHRNAMALQSMYKEV